MSLSDQSSARLGPLDRLKRLFATGAMQSDRPIPAEEIRGRGKPIEARPVDPANIGRGFADPRHRDGTKRIAVTVDDDLFERVRNFATAGRISFAAAARQLIERGLLAPPPFPPHDREG
jgi:hypothetical protein